MKKKLMIEGPPLSGGSQPAQAQTLVTATLSLYLSPSLRDVSLQQQQLCRASIQHSSSLPNLFPGKEVGTALPALCKTHIHTHIPGTQVRGVLISIAMGTEALKNPQQVRLVQLQNCSPSADSKNHNLVVVGHRETAGQPELPCTTAFTKFLMKQPDQFLYGSQHTRRCKTLPQHPPTSPKVESTRLHECETTEIA